jgi:hypothetical protein
MQVTPIEIIITTITIPITVLAHLHTVLLLPEDHQEALIIILRLEMIAGTTTTILIPTGIIHAVLISIAQAATATQVVRILPLVPLLEEVTVEADRLVHPDKLAKE